jgi:phage terminase large subunit GpA-like protein
MGYDPDVLPWQTEIMDALADGDVDLMGPAQAGKTEIGLAWWGWTIDHSPADFMICQSDKNLMHDLVLRRLQPMIERVPALQESLLTGNGADNIFLKQFQGMISTHIWPVASQFTARPIERGWLDDFDQIPDDIDGQGSAHKLMEGRQTWFEGRSRTFTSSSPAREDGSGIEARVASGTDERLWPECPHCGDRFEIQFDQQLRYPKGAPEQAEAGAYLLCPANGCIIQPAEKRRVLDSLTRLPNRGWVPLNPAARRRSFRIDGLVNIRSWGSLAKALREAEIAWETRQDEGELRAVWNTKGGKNYRSKAAGLKALVKEDLAGRLEPQWQMGTVPAGCRVLVASVDVQANRWEVMVRGFGEGLESWIVDRFDIATLEDGVTLVDPAMHPEHWAVLTTRVVQRRYPMAQDPTILVPILTVAVDTGGEAGVSQNAANWYRACIRMGISRDRITLVKGSSKIQARPVMAAWLDQKKKGGPEKRGVRLWTVDTHALKNVIDVRLRRTDPGPGAIHFPAGFEMIWLDELTAEQKIKGRWVKMRPRNETLDLMVYTDAALQRPPFAQTRADMGWVPADFRVPVLSGPMMDLEQKVAPAAPAFAAESPPAAAPPLPQAPRPGPPRTSETRRQTPADDWIGAGSNWL